MRRDVWCRHVTLRQANLAGATLLLLDSCPINDQAERDNMAPLPFVVLGDRTTHGGSVISADYTFDVHGKYVARVGDMTVCPRCKGTFPIVSGSPDMTSMGQSPARHGDKTACGATLIAGQTLATWSDQSSIADLAADDKAEALVQAASVAAPTTSGVCLDCLMKAAAAGSSTVVRE